MLYHFAKILMTTGLRFFYRHIHVTGLENIPAKGPAIIISNHHSSLMDAALIGILLKRPIYFFARGDLFVTGAVHRILWWFHMMPIHQHSGGSRSLAANEESFSEGQKIISRGGVIVFFPESSSHTERQLLPFRKGVFRLAFKTGATHNFSFEIPIVPIGITYDHPQAGRKEVKVHAGKPLLLSHYRKYFEDNPSATLLRISKDAQEIMRKEVLHIRNKNRLDMAELCLTIHRNNSSTPSSSWKIKSKNKLREEQEICDKMNRLSEDIFERVVRIGSAYTETLDQHGLEDKTLSPSFKRSRSFFLVCCLPIYLIGIVLNTLPIYVARQVSEKKVYRRDFYSWIFVASYSLMYFVWVILLITVTMILGGKWFFGLIPVMALTGVFAYHYNGWLKTADQQIKLEKLSVKEIAQLKNQRNIVLSPLIS